MNLGRKLAAGIIAVSMMATFSSNAMAADGDASVCVAPRSDASQGVLSVGVFDADFGEIAYDATDRTQEESIIVNVTDTRGVVGDWTVTISGTDFSSTNGTSFAIGNLEVTNMAAAPLTTPGTFTTSGTIVPATSANSPATIVQGNDVGTLNQNFDFADSELTIPNGTLVGVYKSTLTVTITAGTDNSDVCDPVEAEPVTAKPVEAVRYS